MAERRQGSRLSNAARYALLGVPFVGTLWVPLYDRVDPTVGGVPLFYWYQFAWIGIGAAITAVVYFSLSSRSSRSSRSPRGPRS